MCRWFVAACRPTMGAKNRHSCAALRIEWLNVATLCHQYPLQVSALRSLPSRFSMPNAFSADQLPVTKVWITPSLNAHLYSETPHLLLPLNPSPYSRDLTPLSLSLYPCALYPPTVNAVCFRLFFSSTHLTNLPSSQSVCLLSALRSLTLSLSLAVPL